MSYYCYKVMTHEALWFPSTSSWIYDYFILCFLVLIIAANMEYELKTKKQFISLRHYIEKSPVPEVFFYYWLPELLFLFSGLFVHIWLQNLGCKFINLRWNVPYRLHCKHLPHYIFWECKIFWYWSQGKWTEII